MCMRYCRGLDPRLRGGMVSYGGGVALHSLVVVWACGVTVASILSHACPMDETLTAPVVVVPTPVHCPAWTPETRSPTDHALKPSGFATIVVHIDL
jgi:hypothetical protein